MTNILHIIQQLTPGGAARGMIATAKYSSLFGHFHHSVISLLPADRDAAAMAEEAGMIVISAPDRNTVYNEIKKSDIVHINFWNNPDVYELLRSDLPAMRLLIWYHVSGDGSPQIITQKLIDFADINIASNPNTFNNLPLFRDMPSEEKYKKVRMVYDAADFARIDGLKLQKHKNFNVGYIGTVDFVKMHRNYVPMSSAINIPDVKFIVCGGGIEDLLRKQAQQLGALEKFDFRGYVNDIKSVIEIFDVYGYPLCEDTYASAELNLQEVMYAGIPPVVFPYGGVKELIIHENTGLMVNSEQEYKEAIEYLYHTPRERKRIGENAREYAKQIFGAENAAKKLNPIYEEMMTNPKKLRLWGMKSDTSLLYQPVTLEDLTGQFEKPSGAKLFIESLGDKAKNFITSMTSQNISELFEAEKNIADSSPVLQSAGGGGIVHYRNYYPSDPYLRLWTGLIYQNNDNYSQAIPEFIVALNNIPDNFRIAWYLAQTAEKAGNIKLAGEVLQGLVKINPSFTDARNMLARIDGDEKSSIYEEKILEAINTVNELRQINLLDEACSTLLDFIAEYNDSPDLLNLHAELKYQMGETEEARRMLFYLSNRFPEHSQILNNLGAILRSEGSIEEGMSYLIKAVNFDPDNRAATLNLVDVLVSLKKYEEGIKVFSFYLERNPGDTEIAGFVEVLKTQFIAAEEREKIQEGIAEINELRGLELLDEAFSYLSDLQATCPDSPDLLNLEGELEFQTGHIEEAKQTFLSLIERFPDYGQTLNNLGVIYLNEHDRDKAFYYYNKAIEVNKDDIVATLNLADLFVTLDKCEEAEKILSLYLERNPDAEQVRLVLETLKEKFLLKKDENDIKESIEEIKRLINEGDLDIAEFVIKGLLLKCSDEEVIQLQEEVKRQSLESKAEVKKFTKEPTVN